MSRIRTEASSTHEDLMAFARREMARNPTGHILASQRIDAPLRSAFSDEYIREKQEAEARESSSVETEEARG